MALYTLAPQPWLIFLDDSGIYLPNGQLAIYVAGTMTPATTYTSAMGTAHPFPITLDSAGRVPGGLYLQPGQSYKFVLHEPQIEEPLDGGIIKTQDDIAIDLPGGNVLKIMTAGDYTNINVSGVRLIEYHGAGELIIRGLSGGVEGQTLLIRSPGNGLIWLYAQDPAAPAGNALVNFITLGGTPINGFRGMASYTYLSLGYWAMGAHAQGFALRTPFDPANYGTRDAAIWTVEENDAFAEGFYIEGITMFFAYYYQNTSISADTMFLTRLMPYGWKLSQIASTNAIVVLDGGFGNAGAVTAADTDHIGFMRLPVSGAPFPAGVNHLTLLGQIAIPLG